MFTCSKKYIDLPFAHRQHNHKGHCRLIHGHNWAFEFTFACENRDLNGFVIDFGDLKWLKQFLEDMFDHTLVLNQDDPALSYLKEGLVNPKGLQTESPDLIAMFPFAEIRVVPNAGAEGLAEFLFEEVNRRIQANTGDRVYLVQVIAYEDSKNHATYVNAFKTCHHE